MAITVQNVQTATWVSASSVTITKPTELAENDLLVAVIAGYSGSNSDPVTPSGWTKLTGTTGASPEYAVFYKTASSADASASDFTFTAVDADYMAGALYRIDGFLTPLTIEADVSSDTDGLTSGAFTFTISATPAITDALVISAFTESNNDGNQINFSSYTLTGSPTFTERLDTQTSVTANASFAVADAPYASLTEITSVGATINASTDRVFNVLVLLYGAQNASGTTALLTSTPTIAVPTSGGGVGATASLLESSPTFSAPDGTITEPKWINTDKSATSSVVNLDKS